jgi:hypothetical protein
MANQILGPPTRRRGRKKPRASVDSTAGNSALGLGARLKRARRSNTTSARFVPVKKKGRTKHPPWCSPRSNAGEPRRAASDCGSALSLSTPRLLRRRPCGSGLRWSALTDVVRDVLKK